MSELKKSKITPEHVEEARKLKALYEARPSPRLSQAEFGDRFDIGTQGAVWQYLNARTPLNRRAAIGFAEGLGCHVSDFSPRLAADISKGQDLAHPTSNQIKAGSQTTNLSHSLSGSHGELLPVDDPLFITEGDIMRSDSLPERFLFRCSDEMASVEGGLAASPGDVLLISTKTRPELGDIVLIKMLHAERLFAARALHLPGGGLGYLIEGQMYEAFDIDRIGVAEEVRKLRRRQ